MNLFISLPLHPSSHRPKPSSPTSCTEGHPSCDFDVAIEKIGCNWFSNNDYERVQWKCIQTATTVIATTTTTTVATTTPTSSILKKYSVTNHSNSNVSFYTKERGKNRDGMMGGEKRDVMMEWEERCDDGVGRKDVMMEWGGKM